MRRIFNLMLVVLSLLGSPLAAAPMDRSALAELIMPPFSLGDAINDKGVYSLLNSGGAAAGYVFETEPLAPLPGFSGAPINVLVVLDLEGVFLDVRLIEHNEPIFVSGLGEAPFHAFFAQYPGLSISSSVVVGTPYGDAGQGALVYLDGVTKATASVRIAHETVMGAAMAVAREKMQGIATTAPAYPNPDHNEDLSWQDLLDQGLVSRKVVSNRQIEAAFAGTLWQDDDPDAKAAPDAAFMDLWLVDLGPPSVARAVLSDDGFAELQQFLSISPDDEPILVIETARHGLLSPDFIRNTAPNWLSAEQDGLPVGLRDSDLFVELSGTLPKALHDGTALILRTDRRLGFDPVRDWTLHVLAQRQHGIFQPQIGSVTLSLPHRAEARFFIRSDAIKPVPAWQEALRGRQLDMAILLAFLITLTTGLLLAQKQLAHRRVLTPYRLLILALVTGFVGWWGQGQLSIVTVLGVLRTATEGGSFGFLLYDPFSLLIWGFAIFGLFLWGRGFYCGWLCPFGALQEFAHHLGRWLRLPQITPSTKWDQRLKQAKYLLLAGLLVTVFIAPDQIDSAAEIEPFKTAITTYFLRDWYFAAYAAFWLLSGMLMFKGFCRYVCPLGAVMALGGMLRTRDWIARRQDCGSPCQLCRVKCNYGSIAPTGDIQYSECFGCLDCVSIHDDANRCVPQIIAARAQSRSKDTA